MFFVMLLWYILIIRSAIYNVIVYKGQGKKDGVTTWVPTYITETFLTSPAFSILVTTVLPIVNLTGAYLAQYLYQKCKKQEAAAAV